MGKIERIQVAPEDRERLVRLVRDRNTPQKIVWRSQIVLLAGEGMGAAPHYGALTIFRLIKFFATWFMGTPAIRPQRREDS